MKKYGKRIILLLLIILGIHFYQTLPDPLFEDSYSTVLNASDGRLLSAAISHDEQWRFPEIDRVPYRFKTCILNFEDEYFEYHPGFNPISFARAIWQNVKAGKVVSGASTITMQVIRLSRKNRDRTISEKLIEVYKALRLEVGHSKEDILKLYASHAPFGSNVVGLEAAAWRYYGVAPDQLSWGQSATLAVLPNSPALIYPGRNTDLLEAKRNRLLLKLYQNELIDTITYQLACSEPVPHHQHKIPQKASHLLVRSMQEKGIGKRYSSTLDYQLQSKVSQIVNRYSSFYQGNRVNNAAAIVLNVKTNTVLAYIGNTYLQNENHGNSVDVITAQRSTGSTLKPFLYAAMLDDGLICPKSIIADLPIYLNGFSPKNFYPTYEGAVHADEALARSLNIPAVNLLREYRHERFHDKLKSIGMTSLTRAPDHYGLSLILGGADGSLWDLSSMYAGMARVLNNFEDNPLNKPYSPIDYNKPYFLIPNNQDTVSFEKKGKLSAAAIYSTFEALTEVKRPGNNGNWKYFDNSRKIAWKTGTSYGFRDAWSIGVTPEYVVAVWVGNADGEGRPGVVGVEMAAPVMFSIFDQLPQTSWFEPPSREMDSVKVCRKSGYRATRNCENADSYFVPNTCLKTDQCHFCKTIYENDEGQRVNSKCETFENMTSKKYFTLPPAMAWYYKQHNSGYRNLPEWKTECAPLNEEVKMEFVYPENHAKIYVPKELQGNRGATVFEIAHRKNEQKLYWHLDKKFVGTTESEHKMPLQPEIGKHLLTVVDQDGNSSKLSFEVLGVQKK